jgi:hypothetical protein
MTIVVNVDKLEQEGHINRDLANLMRDRAREAMIALVVNLLLSMGILAATGGLLLWLADAALVALAGLAFLLVGALVLVRFQSDLRFFGRAAVLIGAATLLGGAGFEFIDKLPDDAAILLALVGAIAAVGAAAAFWRWEGRERFVLGCVMLMGLGMHLFGLGYGLEDMQSHPALIRATLMYAAVLWAFAGWYLDLRFITALAILPFAEILGARTYYFFGGYAVSSPESTLTIVQMSLAVVFCVWWAGRVNQRHARHFMILALLAFVVANLAALIGSIVGDEVGLYVWGPRYEDFQSQDDAWARFRYAKEAFSETAVIISERVYSVVWAIALAGLVLWAAVTSRRGLFNAGITFACIHGYTQLFETFYDEPLAYVVGGLFAIPLAWGARRLNQRLKAMETE